MSKLAIKYEGCQDVINNLKNISNYKYEDLINDLNDVVSSLNSLTYKPSTSSISNSSLKAEENQGKLMTFANSLESYAEKLNEFDNTFYNNFVLLDGTNYDNYKNNIGSLEISDDEIEQFLEADKGSLERYLDSLMKALEGDYNSDNSLIKPIKKKLLRFGLSPKNISALKFILKGNSFEIIKKGENIFIKITNNKLDPTDLEKCAIYLHDEVKILNDSQLENILKGRNTTKLEKFIERLASDDGAKIYNSGTDKYSKYANKILKGDYGDLNKYIKGAGLGKANYVITNAKNGAIESLLGEGKYIKNNFSGFVKSVKTGGIIDDVKNAKLSSKFEFEGKAFGVADKISTVWRDANENLKDDNGNWTLANAEKDKEFVVDTAVDLGTAAGAAATGAAIGSFVPVVGTVVGAVVGAGISVAINHKFGKPPESAVDKTKEIANTAVDKIGNCIGKIFW